MNILIKNGNVFFDGKFVKTNILIKEGVISELSKDISNISMADTIIDASGKHALPGLIDMHVHFRDFGEEYKEDWLTGSKAALSGGITTVFDMPNNKVPITTKKLLDEKKDYISKTSLVNFGLYAAVTDENISEINESGITIVKLYYGSTTGGIKCGDTEKIFKELKKKILIVAHAEENDVIEDNKLKFDKNDKKYHSLIRDNRAEYTAVNTLIELAEKYDRKLHLTHIGTKESLLLIKQAKNKGLKITCDTCAHYLFLDDTSYDLLGNKAKVNPSLKSKADKDVLWKFLNEGVIDVICSDHAPHTLEEKSKLYETAPSGLPGVETTLPIILTAVNEKKIELIHFIETMTKNPSEIIGIKKKGMIKKGYDGDITIVDLEQEHIIEGKDLFTKAKWTPFEGFKAKGKAVMTIVNGNITYDNGKFFEENKGREVILK